MGFEQFGILSFTSATKTEQFVALLKNKQFCGTSCNSCGAKFFPPRSDCCRCLRSQMDWFTLPDEGTLMTFTMAMYAPIGFEKDIPYLLGVADFGAVKVFGRIDNTLTNDDITIGMTVKIKIVDLESDRISYEFVAAD